MAMPNPSAIFEVDLDTATTITFGDNLQLNGQQALKKSDTDAVASAVESKLSATKILCTYKLLAAASSGIRQVGDAS